MKKKIILGPPGTGKTTRLLRIMEEELASGVAPNRIAFCSFTKKAATEAADRACEKFDYTKRDLPYFRTLHSLGFQQLGLRKDEVMQFKDYKLLGRQLGISFSTRSAAEEGLPVSDSKGDQYAFLDGFSRARMMEPRKAWETVGMDNDFDWHEFKRFQVELGEFKRSRNLLDFGDMLEQTCTPAPVDVVILDEAQDLSTIQWDFVRRVFSGCQRMYIAGDDDQAIFQWSGADIDQFLSLDCESEVLEQSWRVPEQVHALCTTITDRIHHRFPKVYHSKQDPGHVEYHSELDSVDFTDGSWLLLCRNNYQINELAEFVRSRGLPYHIRGESAINKAHVNAIKYYERARKGQRLRPEETALVETYLPPRTTEWPKTIWHEAFTRMPHFDKEYYITLLRGGQSLTADPRVNISTIHGSKGGEADNVLLMTGITSRIEDSMALDADAEHRVWYVGASRCREQLHVVRAESNKAYEL